MEGLEGSDHADTCCSNNRWVGGKWEGGRYAVGNKSRAEVVEGRGVVNWEGVCEWVCDGGERGERGRSHSFEHRPPKLAGLLHDRLAQASERLCLRLSAYLTP